METSAFMLLNFRCTRLSETVKRGWGIWSIVKKKPHHGATIMVTIYPSRSASLSSPKWPVESPFLSGHSLLIPKTKTGNDACRANGVTLLDGAQMRYRP